MSEGPLPTVHVDLEPGWRGGQRQVLLLCRGLAARYHPVTLVALEGGELARRARAVGLDVEETPAAGELDPRAVRAVVRAVRRRRAAVVALHSSRSHGIGALARLALGPGRPAFVVTRRVAFPPRTDLLNRWKYRAAVDGFVAISGAVAAALEAAGVARERIRIVHSGVETPRVPEGVRAAVRDELGLPRRAELAVAVGGLTEEKGHRDLVLSWRRVLEERPRAVLLVVGDGPLREELEDLAVAEGILPEELEFLGHRDDPERLIAAADVLVHPSLMEGLGTVILDAMLLGVPVVATSVGGIPELVEDGVTGVLVPPRSPEALADAVAALLGDRKLARRLAAAARRRAEAAFTADAMVEGTLAAYRELARVPE